MESAEEFADVSRRRVRGLHRGVMRAGRRTRSAAHSHHTLWKYPPSSTRTSTSWAGARGSCSRSSCSSSSSTCRARAAVGGSRAVRLVHLAPQRIAHGMPRSPRVSVGILPPSVAPCAMELTEPSRARSPTSHRDTADRRDGCAGAFLRRPRDVRATKRTADEPFPGARGAGSSGDDRTSAAGARASRHAVVGDVDSVRSTAGATEWTASQDAPRRSRVSDEAPRGTITSRSPPRGGRPGPRVRQSGARGPR